MHDSITFCLIHIRNKASKEDVNTKPVLTKGNAPPPPFPPTHLDQLSEREPQIIIMWLRVYISWGKGVCWGGLESWPTTVARLAGWLRVTQQVWFCTWWMGLTVCLFRTVPVALTWAFKLRADGISISCYIINVQNHSSWANHAKKAWPDYRRPVPSPWASELVQYVWQ
jgi:hypothetical protein